MLEVLPFDLTTHIRSLLSIQKELGPSSRPGRAQVPAAAAGQGRQTRPEAAAGREGRGGPNRVVGSVTNRRTDGNLSRSQQQGHSTTHSTASEPSRLQGIYGSERAKLP